MSRRPEETFSQKRHAAGQQAPEKMLNLANHQGIVNENHNETSHTCQNGVCQKAVKSIEEDAAKRKPLYTFGGTVI